MELRDAEQLAVNLLKQFGLASAWRFEFDSAKRRFGCCHRSQRLITLSRELVLRNDQLQVEDTIRHEIAHALCPPRSGHGTAWTAMCKVTGARPERCYGEEVEDVEGDWTASCLACGKKYSKFRRPKSDRWCGDKECKRKHGRLQPIQKLTWQHKNATFDPTDYAKSVLGVAEIPADARRAAIEHMKAQLLKNSN